MSTQNGQESQNSPSGPVSDQAALSSTSSTSADEAWDDGFRDEAHDSESCPCSHCCAGRYESSRARRERELVEMGFSERDLVEPSPERPDRERRRRRVRDPHLELAAMVEVEAVTPPCAAPATGAHFMARVRENQAFEREFGRPIPWRRPKRPSGALRRALEE